MSRSSSSRWAMDATAVLFPELSAGASDVAVISLRLLARVSRSASSFCATVA